MILNAVRSALVYQNGGRRLFLKVHDLTSPRKLAKFPVPVMISLLLGGP